MHLRPFVCTAATAACGGPPPEVAVAQESATAGRELRICADPNNLPFSNDAGVGFENRLAELLAGEMGAEVRDTWWAHLRGFVRNTVRAGDCDVATGVPAEYELLAVTAPYYRSSYVFLSRTARELDIRSLDDPRLRTLRLGVHVIGDDYANPPPAHALARRGIVSNVAGYSIFGDYRSPNPPARLVEAVTSGEIDVAMLWGPLAGYFAAQHDEPMRIAEVPADPAMPYLPFAFDIAVGVGRDRPELREEIDRILVRQASDVDALLDVYGVPRFGRPAAPSRAVSTRR